MFDATASKYRDITFEKANFDERKDLVERYSVAGPPRLVMLDGNGTVLYNGLIPQTQQGLEQMIHGHY